MARRTMFNTPPGKLYAMEWPEWWVECPDCGKNVLVHAMGLYATAKAAHKAALEGLWEEPPMWQYQHGLWHCPDCAQPDPHQETHKEILKAKRQAKRAAQL